MNDIEKRAIQLLVVEYERAGKRIAAKFAELGTSEHRPAINAIIAALSSERQVPQGWVLAPVDATSSMESAAWGVDIRKSTPADIWNVMISARPRK